MSDFVRYGERHPFLPVRLSADGTVMPALPGLVQSGVVDPVVHGLQAMGRLRDHGTPDHMTDPEGAAALARDSFDAASLAPMASAPLGGIADNAVGVFGGRLARTADQAALARAEELAASGAPREQIWSETGWFQGTDGKWRFEIDDSKFKLNEHGSTADEAYNHPKLHEAYPDFYKARFAKEGGLGGSYFPEVGRSGERITVGMYEGDPASVALHEAQHAVQRREGFAPGANRKQFRGSDVEAERARILSTPEDNGWGSVGTSAPDGSDDAVRFSLYRRAPGEIEARNVQARKDMSADERRSTPPWATQDIPDSDQIILSGTPTLQQSAAPEGALAANSLKREANSPTGASVPLAMQIEKARASRHWPFWGADDPTRALHAVNELEAREAWDDIVKPIQYPDGLKAMERWEAEAIAMQTNADLGHAYQVARRAGLENRKGRALTKGEEMWESLDRTPGAPDATSEELMNTVGREKFMVLGHPDLQRKKLPGSDSYKYGGSVPSLEDFIKRYEGFEPRAQWDYKQYTNGYGTRARSPGEIISREDADPRLADEIAKARAIVEGFAPDIDEGTKRALTDLTFNAGDKWTRSGLGEAVRAGDMDRVRSLFLQYNKAGGETLSQLVRRRQEGADFIGQTDLVASAAPTPSRDYFSGRALTFTGDEIPTEGFAPPMALGGPEAEEPSRTPFNAQSYRVSPEHQAPRKGTPEWVGTGLGLVPQWMDGSMALQGFKNGGRVAGLGALSVAKPTDAQKEAGNYRKAHVRIHGLDISIENTKGSLRSGVGKNGTRWSVKLPDHYGYFKGTEGFDGDHVDCYIGPDVESDRAYIIDQVDADTGKFDEHKVMLGYSSETGARDAYAKAFNDGKAKDRLGALTSMSVADLRDWLGSGDTKRPASRQKFARGGRVTSGALISDVAGRTDHLPLDVASGSFVIPADIVSSLGEGNTLAGTKVLDDMFPKQSPRLQFASGGRVPIMAAGGEYILTPEQVAVVGAGDLSAGHDTLDAWVLAQRDQTIKTLQRLPRPAT